MTTSNKIIETELSLYEYDEYLNKEYSDDGVTFELDCPVCSRRFLSNSWNRPKTCIEEDGGKFSCSFCSSEFKLISSWAVEEPDDDVLMGKILIVKDAKNPSVNSKY